MKTASHQPLKEIQHSVLAMFKDTRLTVALIVVMVLAYFAEAAHPTNAMDYFYDYDAQNGPYYPFYSDGRFAGVLIREITGNIFAPTLYLMLGLMLLVVSGMAVCATFRVTDWKAVVLTCGLFATFPLILEIQSYHPLRITIPLAVFMSIASVISAENHKSLTGWMMGVGTLFIAFNLYQSITYIAILLTIYLAINQLLRGEKLSSTITRSILPRAAIYIIAFFLYLIFVKAIQPYVVWPAVRLDRDSGLISSIAQLFNNYHLIMGGMKEIFYTDIYLFPSTAKLLFLSLATMLMFCISIKLVQMKKTGSLIFFWMLFSFAPFLAFSTSWLSTSAQDIMADRVLYPLVITYIAVFLIALKINYKWLNKYAYLSTSIIVAIFISQVNAWHEYMSIKNQSDYDASSKIVAEIMRNNNYKSDMPIVLVGTSNQAMYLPFRLNLNKRVSVNNSALASIFYSSDTNYRVMQGLLQYVYPTTIQRNQAIEHAKSMPSWPTAGAIEIWNNTVIIKIG